MSASDGTVREYRPETPPKPLSTNLADQDRLDPKHYRRSDAEIAERRQAIQDMEHAALVQAGTILGTICGQDPAAYFQHRDTGIGPGTWYIHWGTNSMRLTQMHRAATVPLHTHLNRMMVLEQRDQFLLSETGMCD